MNVSFFHNFSWRHKSILSTNGMVVANRIVRTGFLPVDDVERQWTLVKNEPGEWRRVVIIEWHKWMKGERWTIGQMFISAVHTCQSCLPLTYQLVATRKVNAYTNRDHLVSILVTIASTAITCYTTASLPLIENGRMIIVFNTLGSRLIPHTHTHTLNTRPLNQ